MTPTKLMIPPRPGVLMEIQNLMAAQEPDVQKIATVIKQDVSLYAILLSAVNSPWMGLSQTIDSAEKAIALMGLDRVFNLLRAVIIRACFKDSPLNETFWSTASEVASISDDLARRYKVCTPDKAYTLGMLHNAGIPVMIGNFDDYAAFINQYSHRAADELCVLERQRFTTDHYLQGAMMAKAWYIPNEIALAIRYQPIATSVLSGQKALPTEVTQLLALVSLAKNISNEYRLYWNAEANTHNETILTAALDYLNIGKAEFIELKEDHVEEMMNKEVA